MLTYQHDVNYIKNKKKTLEFFFSLFWTHYVQNISTFGALNLQHEQLEKKIKWRKKKIEMQSQYLFHSCLQKCLISLLASKAQKNDNISFLALGLPVIRDCPQNLFELHLIAFSYVASRNKRCDPFFLLYPESGYFNNNNYPGERDLALSIMLYYGPNNTFAYTRIYVVIKDAWSCHFSQRAVAYVGDALSHINTSSVSLFFKILILCQWESGYLCTK